MSNTTIGFKPNISKDFSGGGANGYTKLNGGNPFEESKTEPLWKSAVKEKQVVSQNDPVHLLFEQIDSQPLSTIFMSTCKDLVQEVKSFFKSKDNMVMSERKNSFAYN